MLCRCRHCTSLRDSDVLVMYHWTDALMMKDPGPHPGCLISPSPLACTYPLYPKQDRDGDG